jgi:hypothetical protein
MKLKQITQAVDYIVLATISISALNGNIGIAIAGISIHLTLNKINQEVK